MKRHSSLLPALASGVRNTQHNHGFKVREAMNGILLCAALLLGAQAFVACSSDDNEDEATMSSFGYVVGKVNNVEYNLVNTPKNEPVNLPVHGGDENLEVLIWGQELTSPADAAPLYLHLIMRSVHTGLYLMKHSAEVAELGSQTLSGFCIHREGRNGEAAAEYVPTSDDAFSIQVHRLFWSSPSAYASLECELNGILCNKDNPKDTLVVSNLKIGLH